MSRFSACCKAVPCRMESKDCPLQSGACEQAGLTDEDIFNRYTGDGGLHGLRRSDYENYNAFSAAKKELENGQFFTPPPLCVRVNTLQTDIGALEEEFARHSAQEVN